MPDKRLRRGNICLNCNRLFCQNEAEKLFAAILLTCDTYVSENTYLKDFFKVSILALNPVLVKI